MIIEEDDINAFLEHHGVRGQKWGVRNKTNIINETPQDRKKRHQRNARRIGIGIRLAPVAIVIAGVLLDSKKKKLFVSDHGISSKFNSSTTLKTEEARRNGAFKMSELLKKMGTESVYKGAPHIPFKPRVSVYDLKK